MVFLTPVLTPIQGTKGLFWRELSIHILVILNFGKRKTLVLQGFSWYTIRGSNPRHPD